MTSVVERISGEGPVFSVEFFPPRDAEDEQRLWRAIRDLDTDTDHLVRKLRAGADFGIAQLFFQPEDFLRLRDRLAARGCDAPMLPGVMPLTTVRTLRKAVELSGAEVPPAVAARLDPYV